MSQLIASTGLINYEELAGSPRERYTERGLECVRRFKVPWADRHTFAQSLMGDYAEDGTLSTEPLPLPGFPNCFVRDIEMEPFLPEGVDDDLAGIDAMEGEMNAYTGGALITSVYSTDYMSKPDKTHPFFPNAYVPDGTYLTYEADFGGEMMTTDGRTFKWSDGSDVPPEVNPGIVVPTSNHKIEWFWVRRPPWAAIRRCQGKVNDAPFLLADATGDPANSGSILFLGCTPIPCYRCQVDGPMLYRLVYRFAEQVKTLSTGVTVGWNYQYKKEAVGPEHWVAIEDEDNNPPFQEDDFSDLFAFGPAP